MSVLSQTSSYNETGQNRDGTKILQIERNKSPVELTAITIA